MTPYATALLTRLAASPMPRTAGQLTVRHQRAGANSSLRALERQGLVGSFRSGPGVLYWFITEKGKGALK
jgi:hypothetical protein